MTSEERQRAPGTSNAAESATEESLRRARGGHSTSNQREHIDGAADAPPGSAPAKATPNVSPGGDPLSEAHDRKSE
jgi:hypothetical protein